VVGQRRHLRAKGAASYDNETDEMHMRSAEKATNGK
jgi:hypothetical protein